MKLKISNYIEKHNTHIQVILFIALLIAGIVFPLFNVIEKDNIIISLLALISFEILFLFFHNDQFQDKIYSLFFNKLEKNNMVLVDIDKGYRVFLDLLAQVDEDLFISGITCSSLMSYISDFEEILKKGCNINILLSTIEGLKSNTLVSEGKCFDEDDMILASVSSQRNILLKKFMTVEIIKTAIINEKLTIKETNIPFTVAYVGIDIFDNSVKQKKLKITQYIPGCKVSDCPCILINSHENSKLYGFYDEYLKKSWENADSISIFNEMLI